MQPTVTVLLTKVGDVRGEVREIVDRVAQDAGMPIEEGLHNLLYLPQTDVTVAELNEHGGYLKEHLLSSPGWRDESARNNLSG